MSNFWQNLGNKTKQLLQLTIAVATVVFIFYLIPKTQNFKYDYDQGTPWQYKDLYSPYDFAIIKSEDSFEKEKEKIQKTILKHYVKKDVLDKSFNKFEKVFNSRLHQIDSSNINFQKQDLLQKAKEILKVIYLKGVLSTEKNEDIMLVENNVAKHKNTSDFLNFEEAKNEISISEYTNQQEKSFLVPLLKMSLFENIVYDENLNNSLLQKKLSEISSTRGMIRKNEKIISKGEIINAENYQKLISFEKKYSEQILGKSQYYYMALGYILLISILIAILVLYLYIYQQEIFNHFRHFSLIFLLINSTVFLVSIFAKADFLNIYILPFTIVPIVLRAFFKRETALYVHLTIVLLAGFFVAKSFPFVFIQITAGVTAIYGNKDVKYWSQFFKAIAFIFLAYLISYIGITLAENGNIESLEPVILGYLVLNVFFSFLAYPLIVFFEKIFGLLTDISLVEYTDINKPLLKKLSIEAPGTFQHSLQVANLAEAAATELGANSLLIKVGALYHDVGKMSNRIYFIENQFPEENPHEKLSYEKSAKIIIAHVTDGVKLAKKNNLPQQIIDFIRTHHGTSRVEYFYRMHAKVNPEEKIDELNFKYPGPAPFTKEQAILMMADSVEAASKSLKNPTSESLNDLVDNIVGYQLKRAQFDNAPITLLEITKCKEVFKKMLASIYHIRIEYPD